MTLTPIERGIRILQIGTAVVSTLDGEAGRILAPATYNRNHTKVTSYAVVTSEGREIWDVGDIMLPESH